MTITGTAWEKYINALRQVNDAAADRVRKVLERYDLNNLSPATRQEIINWVYDITATYSEASAELACQMYDAISEASGVSVPPAEPAPIPEYKEVAIATNGTLKTMNPDIVAQASARLVKRTGVDTTMNNAIRDGAMWAWIPMGDTCAFCRILASNGWQRASKKAMRNGHADHIHANCDCTYAISHKGGEEYSSIYDPDKYLEEYEDAKGNGKWREALNKMRREDYAKMPQKEKDMLNAHKRAMYAQKNEGNILKALQNNGVTVNIADASDKDIATQSLQHLSKLVDEYNSTIVSYSIDSTSRASSTQEAGSAYMLNGKTSVSVLNRGLRKIKATDQLRLGDNQPFGVTYHEFAHTLSQSREKMTPDFWKEMRKLFKEYKNQISSPDWFSSLKISDYAGTDVDEFMAEAFTQAKLKEEPSPYAIRALEIIDKHFKK